MPKKRKRDYSSDKENTPALRMQSKKSHQSGYHRQTAGDRAVLRILKEDLSRRLSFERRTEKHLEEVHHEAQRLRREVESFKDCDCEALRVLKEDVSRRRSFEGRTERHLEEITEETRLLRKEVQSFATQRPREVTVTVPF